MLRDALWEVVLLVVLHATCCCLKRVSERKNRIKMTIYDIVITCHCIIVCVHNCTYMSIYTYIYIQYTDQTIRLSTPTIQKATSLFRRLHGHGDASRNRC